MITLENILWLVAFAFSIYCAWRLVSKTGNAEWLSLLCLIPGLNIALFLYLVFSEWPIEAELKRYKTPSGPLPSGPGHDDLRMAIGCLQCSAEIPLDSDACLTCGWTYNEPQDIPEGKETEIPASSQDYFFRKQRGF